jgi:hypothetical protein
MQEKIINNHEKEKTTSYLIDPAEEYEEQIKNLCISKETEKILKKYINCITRTPTVDTETNDPMGLCGKLN